MEDQISLQTVDMTTKIVELLVHQNESNNSTFGKNWSTNPPNFQSALLLSSARIINEADNSWKWWSDPAAEVSVENVKSLVTEHFALILSNFMLGSADKEYTINYLAPRLLGMFTMLNTPDANVFNGESLIYNTHTLQRRLMINEDLTVISLSLVHQVLTSGMNFDEIYKRVLIRKAVRQVMTNPEFKDKLIDSKLSNNESVRLVETTVLDSNNSEMYHNFEDIYQECLSLLIKE